MCHVQAEYLESDEKFDPQPALTTFFGQITVFRGTACGCGGLQQDEGLAGVLKKQIMPKGPCLTCMCSEGSDPTSSSLSSALEFPCLES